MYFDIKLLSCFLKAPVGIEERSEYFHQISFVLQSNRQIDHELFSPTDSKVRVKDGDSLLRRVTLLFLLGLHLSL